MRHPNRANVVEVTRALVRAKIKWRHPIYLIHALTARCNARCGFCAWNFYDDEGELNTDEIKQLYSAARAAGFMALTTWGGEPLVRRDVGEILEHAHRVGLITNLVTNGVLLKRKLDQVVPWVDRVCISVDHASERHDEMRGIPGLFAKIIDATHAVRARDPSKKIVFNCTLQKGNIDRASIQGMADLMREMNVIGIFNALRLEAAADNADEIDIARYNPTQEELNSAFEQVRSLKTAGYPILNSFTHIDKMSDGPPVYRCHWPKFMLPVEANGDVVDCMHWGTRPLGNIRDTPFSEILASPRLRDLAGARGESCHRCVSLHRVEISEIWDGNLEPLKSWWKGVVSEQPEAPTSKRARVRSWVSERARRLPLPSRPQAATGRGRLTFRPRPLRSPPAPPPAP